MIEINGRQHDLSFDPRTSLLDLLRGGLGLTGTKIGCNQGGCGACTVLLDGRRVLSCLTLAVQCEGRRVTTIEGIAALDGAEALQDALVEHDGFQCGYCTPGQICSAMGMVEEARQGVPSMVSADLTAAAFDLGPAEIRERMSGNLCRCAAYSNIVAAIQAAAGAQGEQEDAA